MKLRSTSVVLGLVAAGLVTAMAAFAFGGGGRADPAGPGQAATAPSASPQRTSTPRSAPAEGEPQLASIRAAHPRHGQVLQASGPFDDRFILESPTFDGSAVSGAVLVTSDVSDLLELQVLAGFYDKQGNLLGTSRFVHHLGADGSHSHVGAPQERTKFKIPVPTSLASRAVSAAIGVPVLVNE